MLKNLLAVTLICLLLGGSLWIYWNQEFKHYLPIENAQLQAINSKVLLADSLSDKEKPGFYHFFDARCKNALINMDHLIKIFEIYQDDITFYLVVPNAYSETALRKNYPLPVGIQVVPDPESRFAEKLGIQSTPYAAILDIDNTLYFRGNYRNAKGLCGANDIKWSAPVLALEAKYEHKKLPFFYPYQLAAAGCRIN